MIMNGVSRDRSMSWLILRYCWTFPWKEWR